MKKITILFTLMFLVIGILSFAQAVEDNATPTLLGEGEPETTSEDVEIELEDAGQVPGDFFYGFDKGFDNLRLFLTFNEERKIERSLRIAEERLAEAKLLAERGDVKRAEQARLQHDKFLEKAQERFLKIEAKDEDGLRKIARLQDRIDSHEEKILSVKAKVFAKLSENLTAEEFALLEEIFANFEAKIKEARSRVIENKLEKERRYQEFSNLTDEQIAEILNRIEDEEGIRERRELRSVREERRFNEKIFEKEDKLSRLQEMLNNENLTEEDRLEIEEDILELQEELGELEFEKEEKVREKLLDDIRDQDQDLEQVFKKIQDAREEIAESEADISESGLTREGLIRARANLKKARDILTKARIEINNGNIERAEALAEEAEELAKDVFDDDDFDKDDEIDEDDALEDILKESEKQAREEAGRQEDAQREVGGNSDSDSTSQ